MNFDVRAITDEIYKNVRKKVTKLDKKPVLALISTTDGVGVRSYKKSIIKNLEPLGIVVNDYDLTENPSSTEEVLARLNSDENTDAVLVLKPLAEGLDEKRIDEMVAPSKDVDAVSPQSLGRLMVASDGFIPCTAEGVIKLLDHEGIDVKGKNVVIVNNSQTIGKPLAMLLTNRFATVSLCHEFTKDLADYMKNADILVTGAGVSGLITEDMLKDGAVVIDVGVTMLKKDGKEVLKDGKKVRCGDVEEGCGKKASLITSLTPGLGGGTGPLTTALLAEHVLDSLERS